MKKRNTGKSTIHFCSFSSDVIDLKKGERTEENVISILKERPKISTWDMSENPWLCSLINRLVKSGKIKEEESGYPWHKYSVVGIKKVERPSTL